jgi:hypothetical protein
LLRHLLALLEKVLRRQPPAQKQQKLVLAKLHFKRHIAQFRQFTTSPFVPSRPLISTDLTL